jgi:type II secretory pathway pseudopilin PulG
MLHLIELLVVIAIIAVLASLIVGKRLGPAQVKEAQVRAQLRVDHGDRSV